MIKNGVEHAPLVVTQSCLISSRCTQQATSSYCLWVPNLLCTIIFFSILRRHFNLISAYCTLASCVPKVSCLQNYFLWHSLLELLSTIGTTFALFLHLSWWYFRKCANHLFITNCRRHFAFIRQGSCRCKKIQFSPTQIYFRQSFKLLLLQFWRILHSIIHRFIYYNLTCAFWTNIYSSISLHLHQVIFDLTLGPQ